MAKATRVDIALGGMSLSPDDRTGPPRIAWLTNMRQAEDGRLEKSLGFQNFVPYGSQAIACGITPQGVSFYLQHVTTSGPRPLADYVQVEAGAMGGLPSAWLTATRQSSGVPVTVCSDEAPKTSLIFGDPRLQYLNCGVLASGDLVTQNQVFAEAIPLNGYPYPSVQIAVVQNGYGSGEIVHRHKLPISLPYTARAHVTAVDKYLVTYYTATELAIYYYNDYATSPTVLAGLTGAVTSGARTHLAIAYDRDQDALLVIDSAFHYWLVGASTGAILRTGSLMIAGSPNGASIGVSASSHLGHFFVSWFDNSSLAWSFGVHTITASTYAVTTAPVAITSCALALPTTPFTCYQAKVTAWYDPVNYSVQEGAMVAVYTWREANPVFPGVVGHWGSVVFGVNVSSVLSRSVFGMNTFATVPASAPIHLKDNAEENGGFPAWGIWAYQNFDLKTPIRSLMFLTQGTESYYEGGAFGEAPGTVLYPEARSHAFVGGVLASAPLGSLLGGISPAVYFQQLSGNSENVNLPKRGMLLAALGQKDASTNNTDVYLVSQVLNSRYRVPWESPDSLQQIDSPNGSYLTSAVPFLINNGVSGQGVQHPQMAPYVSTNTTGTEIAAGSYLYVAHLEWRDKVGNTYRGPVSNPQVWAPGAASRAELKTHFSIWEPWMLDAKVRIFRTTSNGRTFYSVFDLAENAGTGWVSKLDTTPDSTLITREILYTQGANGALSGKLEWWGMPPCRCAWSNNDRMIAGGLENVNLVRFSNLFYPGEGVSWPNHAAFSATVAEPVIGVAALEGVFLVFSRTKIWVITGQGPDALGNGSFDTPRLISIGIGLHSPKSLVETPDGIMFQAEDAQIYLLQRGTLQVVLMSGAIRHTIGKGFLNLYTPHLLPYGDEVLPQTYVVGAVYDSQLQEAWFTEAKQRHWVYQVDQKVWRQEINAANHGKGFLRSSIGRTSSTVSGTTYHRTGPVFTKTDYSDITLERVCRKGDSPAYFDAAADFRNSAAHTNVIDITNGRLRRVWAREWRPRDLSYATDGTFQGTAIYFFFDGLHGGVVPDETQNLAGGPSDDTRILDVECAPARQKCNQFQICWMDGEIPGVSNGRASISLLGLSVGVVPSSSGKGPVRNTTGSWRTG